MLFVSEETKPLLIPASLFTYSYFRQLMHYEQFARLYTYNAVHKLYKEYVKLHSKPLINERQTGSVNLCKQKCCG